jgi:oxygen-independent coproporphyrinogen III oxidase
MAGIYIHIPFCKKACHYCNFHFSTTLHHKLSLCQAITKEISLRANELLGQTIKTVYFGGGTPSLLSPTELNLILNALQQHFDLSQVKEFTLEANPDDITEAYLEYLKSTPINRLSLGIQSFIASDLQWMNRAHQVEQSIKALELAKAYGFYSLNLDLMYGLPSLSEQEWLDNIATAIGFEPEHISAYCLTVEPKTALASDIAKGKIAPLEEELASTQFNLLRQALSKAGYIHYEISNFSKPNKMALHNTNYWRGENYLGLGPAAHSFNGKERAWNVANNLQYIKQIEQHKLPITIEHLTDANQLNEFVMTGLRTIWGISLEELEQKFGSNRKKQLMKDAEKYLKQGQLAIEGSILSLSQEHLFFADGIASELFQLD